MKARSNDLGIGEVLCQELLHVLDRRIQVEEGNNLPLVAIEKHILHARGVQAFTCRETQNCNHEHDGDHEERQSLEALV